MKTILCLLLLTVIPGYAQWDTVKTNATRHFYGIHVLENKIWIAGINYRMSLDSGSTMDSIPINPGGYVVEFRDSLNGVMIGRDTTYNSSDGGKTWMKTPKRSPMLHDITYNGTGYVATGPSKRFGFSKDGQSWNYFQAYDPLRTPYWIEFYSLAFLDSLNGCAVGDSGVIALTDDGGESWTISHSGPFWNIFGITAVNGKYLASASRGDLLLSLDKGKTWSSAGKLGNKDLIDITYINENVGYVLGQGILYQTKDAGRTWKSQEVHTDIRKIAFSSEFLGYGIGLNGRMIRTTSGGETISITSEQSTKNVCSENPIKFSINIDNNAAPYSYQWYYKDGNIPESWIVAGGVFDSTITIIPTSAVDIYVHVRNKYNADTTVEFSYNFTQSPPAIIHQKSPNILEVLVDIQNPRLDYQWFEIKNGIWKAISEMRNKTFFPENSGTYAVELYNYDTKCYFRSTPYDHIMTGVEEDDESVISISGNRILIPQQLNQSITIVDIRGSIVLQSSEPVIDLGNLSNGVYYIICRTEHRFTRSQFIIQR